MLTRDPEMEVGKSGPEDKGLCLSQEVLGTNFPSPGSPAALLAPYLEGRGSLPPSRPSSGPAEGDPPPFAVPPQLSPGAFRPLNPSSTSSASSSSPLTFVVQQPSFQDETERLTPSSDVSSSSLDRLTPDEASQRTLRKRRVGGGLAHGSLGASASVSGHCICPVCGVTVRPHDLRTHFHHESKLLDKIPKQVSRHHTRDSPGGSSSHSSAPCSSTSSGTLRRDSVESRTSPASRTEIFERVKSNRNSRLSARAGRPGEECREAQCPVCHRHLQGTASQLNRHAEACLRKRSGGYVGSSEDEEVDVEGEGCGAEGGGQDEPEEDEYRWAGHTRLRVTSLLRGNYEACGFTTVRPSAEDDEDLNVDGDDTLTYGQPQYTESDVIPCGSNRTSREDEALRRALSARNEESSSEQNQVPKNEDSQEENTLGQLSERENLISSEVKTEPVESDDPPKPDQASGSRDSSVNCGESTDHSMLSGSSEGSLQTRPTDQHLLIAALHQQIAELRRNSSQKQEVLKCLVCMDPYNKPVVSVGCWHVYCEECWLRTLGAKKLCPQCNTITSASDLRKIYI